MKRCFRGVLAAVLGASHAYRVLRQTTIASLVVKVAFIVLVRPRPATVVPDLTQGSKRSGQCGSCTADRCPTAAGRTATVATRLLSALGVLNRPVEERLGQPAGAAEWPCGDLLQRGPN